MQEQRGKHGCFYQRSCPPQQRNSGGGGEGDCVGKLRSLEHVDKPELSPNMQPGAHPAIDRCSGLFSQQV